MPTSSSTSRNGLLAAGNWIVDHVKMIDLYPRQDALANISGESSGNGGCAYNVAKDLARLECGFPLYAAGLVGDDEDGQSILGDCRAHNIDTRCLQVTRQAPTSYTDVMTVTSTGRRTFFHQRGANSLFGPSDCDPAAVPASHLHLGYFGLLDTLDAWDEQGISGHQHLFRRARAAGMTTSADLVSAEGTEFRQLVLSALPDIDYLFLNEYEAERISGLSAGPAESPEPAAMEKQARAILESGVKKAVFLHFSGGVIAVSTDGEEIRQGAAKVPAAQIAGSAGAGDALAAGILLGLMRQFTLHEIVELGVCAAAVSLEAATCSDSLRPWQACLDFGRSLGYRDI